MTGNLLQILQLIKEGWHVTCYKNRNMHVDQTKIKFPKFWKKLKMLLKMCDTYSESICKPYGNVFIY